MESKYDEGIFSSRFSCTSDCIFATKAPKLCEQIWNQLSNGKSKATCSNISACSLLFLCEHPQIFDSILWYLSKKKCPTLFNFKYPSLATCVAAKQLENPTNKSTGRKHEVLLMSNCSGWPVLASQPHYNPCIDSLEVSYQQTRSRNRQHHLKETPNCCQVSGKGVVKCWFHRNLWTPSDCVEQMHKATPDRHCVSPHYSPCAQESQNNSSNLHSDVSATKRHQATIDNLLSAKHSYCNACTMWIRNSNALEMQPCVCQCGRQL